MSYELKPKNQIPPNDELMSNAETLGLISLEPRILLDVAGFVTGAEVAAEAMAIEGAELGVEAIFEGGQEPAEATPIGGPWLGEIALTDSGDVLAATPIGGPWL